MSDLAQFLLDQIAADEVDANEDHYLGCDYPGPCRCAELRPYSRNTPTRVLAECAAKRRIVYWLTDIEAVRLSQHVDGDPVAKLSNALGAEHAYVLKLLSEPYRSHPGFDASWLLEETG